MTPSTNVHISNDMASTARKFRNRLVIRPHCRPAAKGQP